MLDLLDFGEFLKRRAEIRRASDAQIREIARGDHFSAWKFNVTESLAAGIPGAILSFIIGGILFRRPQLEDYDFEDQLMIVASGNSAIASAWVLPLITFGLAFLIAFVFVLGLPRAANAYAQARRVYLLVEGAHGLWPQSIFVAGLALALPAVALIEAFEIDVGDPAGIEGSRVNVMAIGMAALGAVLTVSGAVWSFFVNAIHVPGLVARICGARPGSGVALRVLAHAVASFFAGYLVAGLALAIIQGFGWGTALVFLTARQWLLGG